MLAGHRAVPLPVIELCTNGKCRNKYDNETNDYDIFLFTVIMAAAQTVLDGIILCGIPDANPFGGQTQAVRIATELFNDSFTAVKNKTFSDLDEDLKGFSILTVNQGQLRFQPGIKHNLRAFIQWTRDEFRMSRDPADTVFPVANVAILLDQYRTHKQFVDNAELMSKAAKPRDFTNEMKWTDWEPTLVGYLKTLPGRDGVPLAYIIRNNEVPDPTPMADFLDEYVANAPLTGDTYAMDNAQVATLIKSFVVGNTEAETKIQTLATPSDGRGIYRTLKEHYAGQGVYAIDLRDAEGLIENLYYTGEKRPHMWWIRFEQQLKWAYSILDQKEGRQVYSDERKLKKLLEFRIKADFLTETKASLLVDLSRIPMRLSFDEAMAALRASVQANHPDAFSGNASHHITRRSVNETNRGRGSGRFSGRGRGGRGRGRGGGGRGRGYNGNNGGGSGKRMRSDSEFVKLKNGKTIEYHPSFRFNDDDLRNFPSELYERMQQERADYNNKKHKDNKKKSGDQSVKEIASAIISQMSHMSGSQAPPREVNADTQTHVSQVSTGNAGSTMYGGRNGRTSQAQGRQN